MINLNSIGYNSFNVEISDSPLYTASVWAEGWTLLIQNKLQNVVKTITIPATPQHNDRYLLIELNGVPTEAQEDLTPAGGQLPQVYFGKEGIGTWIWSLQSNLLGGQSLTQGYLTVVSNDASTQEVEKAVYVSTNEDLQTIIYTS